MKRASALILLALWGCGESAPQAQETYQEVCGKVKIPADQHTLVILGRDLPNECVRVEGVVPGGMLEYRSFPRNRRAP